MVTFNIDSLDFVDDEEARFGADADFATRFDSGNSRLELEDLTNAATAFVPTDVGTDLVGGKFAETVAEGKALADDGNVYDTIQQAVDSASSWVKAGPGRFNESVVVSTAGLTLGGSGYRTHIRSPEDGVNVTASDVTVMDLSTTAQGDGVHVSDVAATDATIKNVSVRERTEELGIRVRASDAVILNCHINSADNRGVRFYEPQYIIAGCTILDVGEDVASGYGIQAQGDDGIVAYNYIDGTDDFGIFVQANDQVIIGNRIKNTADDGISVSGNDCIVANNRISEYTNQGIDDGGTGTVLDANLIT